MTRLQISISFRPSQLTKSVLDSLLQVFETSSAFSASEWGYDEQTRMPYERETIINALTDDDVDRYVSLFRQPYSKYNAFISNPRDELGKFEIDFEGNVSAKTLRQGFDLGFQLAQIIESDFAFVHWVDDVTAPRGGPPKGALEKRVKRYTYSTEFTQAALREKGLRAIYARTWLSGDFLRQLEPVDFKNLDCATETTSWGALQIDLLEQPWLAEAKSLMCAQEVLVKLLQQAGLVGDYSKSWDVSAGEHWQTVVI